MTNGSDPAYMVIGTYAKETKALPTGLTKRELFSAMAMQALLTVSGKNWTGQYDFKLGDASLAAADTLLEALNREEKKC